MIQHEITVHLNCPVDKIFVFLAEAKNLRAWQTNLVENEQLTEGPIRVGTRFREVRRTGPRNSDIQAEITVFEPNKRFATKTIIGPQATVSYTLDAEGGGTKLTYRFALQMSGIMKLLEPMIAGSIKKDTESDFQKLKSILES